VPLQEQFVVQKGDESAAVFPSLLL
jgi:hypothetical protein